MKNATVFYLQNTPWQDVEAKIIETGDPNLKEEITILPVSPKPDFHHYLIISLSDAGNQVLQNFNAMQIPNSGVLERLGPQPQKPVFGNNENLDFLR